MNKFLLKSLAVVSVISLGHADPLTVIDPINVLPGNSLKLENADSYTFSSQVSITGNDEHTSTLTATKPVEVATDGTLQLSGNATATLEDTLTISGGGTLRLNPTGEKVPTVNVKGKLVYEGFVNAWATEGSEISIQKKEGEEHALFDISKLTLTGGYSPVTVNGNKVTFLEYYNAETDLSNVEYSGELASLNGLKDSEDPKKADLVTALRTKITNYSSNANYAALKDMKIQDYLISAGDGGVTVFDTNKVKFEMDGMETLIGSDENTKNAVEAKEGLSLVGVDGTGSFDFYTAFNEQGGNSSIPNTAGNSFVQWPNSYQLPLSNETSNNTEFDFKTDLAPAEGHVHDMFLTNGVQDVETVKFSGNNSAFVNKVILNGKLKNVQFGSNNGYVAIDALNVAGDLSLSIANGGINGEQGINNIKVAPIVSDSQKINFSTGSYNTINFTSADSAEKVYNFDTFNMGTGSVINVGDNQHQGITLVL